jgi:protein SCO1/2
VGLRGARAATFAAAAAAAALGVAAWLYVDAQRHALPEIRGYVLATPRELPVVELVDEHGAPFRPAEFSGRWSFLYFGYTYCPDVCPLTLVELAGLKQRLAAEARAEPVAFYLVSVDPQRDTPARLREYVAYFDSELRGLTGSAEALAALASATETLFDVPEDRSGDNYLVSHSSNVVLLDPDGRFHAVFTPPHDPATLAADFTKVTERYDDLR